MAKEKGNVSVSTENIFPIIRKWLYSDRDIFLRELVSNAADAISKMKKLTDLGEASIEQNEEFKINVTLDTKKNRIVIEDNGIGMTADEIKKYINQIAFSGAVDFVEKYKDKTDQSKGIIGHFGLGFYSAFMVANKVRIDSLSYTKDAQAASWVSKDGMEYEIGDSKKKTRGTTITIDLNDEAKEFLTGDKCLEILNKYCSFMPYPVFFLDVVENENRKERNDKKVKENENKTEDKKEEKDLYLESIGPAQINETSPLWLKDPKDCTDEEYKEFYKKAFSDYRDPLFWIHLNMDYPFNLKGILYFPKTNNTYESLEGRIKLYYNQVFVADNIKEVIPEFLFLLKGTIDCPDLPLNVSRSFLQNDGYVNKLSNHIIKKVADKLTSLFKNSREDYNKYWADIGVFVKYGCLREEKFYDKVNTAILAKTVDGEMKAIGELGEKIYYTNDPQKQVTYIEMAKTKENTVIVMDHELDNNFMSFLESKKTSLKFLRVDSQIEGEDGPQERKETLESLFREATGKNELEVQIKSLGENSLAAVLSETEESRRMQEMQKMYMQQLASDSEMDFESMFPVKQILVINSDSTIVSKLAAMFDVDTKKDRAKEIAQYLYDLARLSHGSLDANGMKDFLLKTTEIVSDLD